MTTLQEGIIIASLADEEFRPQQCWVTWMVTEIENGRERLQTQVFDSKTCVLEQYCVSPPAVSDVILSQNHII